MKSEDANADEGTHRQAIRGDVGVFSSFVFLEPWRDSWSRLVVILVQICTNGSNSKVSGTYKWKNPPRQFSDTSSASVGLTDVSQVDGPGCVVHTRQLESEIEPRLTDRIRRRQH